MSCGKTNFVHKFLYVAQHTQRYGCSGLADRKSQAVIHREQRSCWGGNEHETASGPSRKPRLMKFLRMVQHLQNPAGPHPPFQWEGKLKQRAGASVC